MLPDKKIRAIAIQLKDATNTITNGCEKFIYMGKSMNPILKEGDQISVEYVRPKDLCLGDIIVYKSEDKLIVHRFLYRNLGRDNMLYIIAKADNSSRRDIPARYDCLLGKVFQINKSGKILKLENNFWRIVSYFSGVVSLLKAIIFETICVVRMKFFKKLKIKKIIRQGVAKLIRMPKLFLSKILVSILKYK